MDADAGGAADLQTDVMRFMAIISMCLVAIFALVQSIPLNPIVESESESGQTANTVNDEVLPEREASEPDEDIVLTRPVPPKPEPRPESVALERPSAMPTTRRRELPTRPSAPPSTAERPEPAASAPPPAAVTHTPEQAQQGFTLRFESDRALTRLVAQDVVGLYAISEHQAVKMAVDGGQYSFWPASTPARFHEMDANTVPDPVMSAFRRRNAAASDTRWGVALPTGMSRTLNELLQQHDGGALVIGADGQLRMEP